VALGVAPCGDPLVADAVVKWVDLLHDRRIRADKIPPDLSAAIASIGK